MDLALFTRNRLKRLRLSPRNLARATRMTESYIARLPKPNSVPTAPNRTDMQDQLERVLKLPQGHLAKLADPAAP
jgi:predicted transcriptional regulator